MPFIYRAFTANCGNDMLDYTTCERIVGEIEEDAADFYVLNCQEIKYLPTLEQFQEITRDTDYDVTCPNAMLTATSPLAFFFQNTGIATFIIYRKGIEIEITSKTEARRNKDKIGSGYNKGGLLTEATITKGDESIRVQMISGHLDSARIDKRAEDWQTVVSLVQKSVETWSDLVNATPNLLIIGYDANTRNIIKDGVSINPWEVGAFEVEGLQQVNLDSQRYSLASTYKANNANVINKPDPKRFGYAKGGMLDFVGIADGEEPTPINTHANYFGFSAGNARDHFVIGSPSKEYSPPASEFELVKRHLITRLANAAPILAQDIKKLSDSSNSKQLLCLIHHVFLEENGLLDKKLRLYQRQLKKLENQPSAPWFSTVNLLEDSNLQVVMDDFNSQVGELEHNLSLLLYEELN